MLSYNIIILLFYLIDQCLIGNDDVIMTCILKTPNMLKQIQKAVEDKTPTKLIIESFQKRDGLIFTSERTSLELDVEVLKNIYLTIIKKYNETFKLLLVV